MSTHPSGAKTGWRQALLVPGRAGRASVILAIVAPPAAAAALAVFRARVTDSALALVMVAVVVLVVTPGRRLAALVAGVSAGLWFDFFLTRPYESFAINHSADIQTAVLLFVVAVGVGELAARERHHRAENTSGGEGLAAVQAVAELVDEGAAVGTVTDAVRDALISVLHLDSCHFDPSPAAVTIPYIERPGYVSYEVYRWDTASQGFPVSSVTLPVRFRGRLLGRFMLQGPIPSVPVDDHRLITAVVLADVAGLALGGAGRQRPLAPAN